MFLIQTVYFGRYANLPSAEPNAVVVRPYGRGFTQDLCKWSTA